MKQTLIFILKYYCISINSLYLFKTISEKEFLSTIMVKNILNYISIKLISTMLENIQFLHLTIKMEMNIKYLYLNNPKSKNVYNSRDDKVIF
jgi:hypothetical protein